MDNCLRKQTQSRGIRQKFSGLKINKKHFLKDSIKEERRGGELIC